MKKNTGLNAPYRSHQENTLHTAYTRIFYYSDLKNPSLRLKIYIICWSAPILTLS